MKDQLSQNYDSDNFKLERETSEAKQKFVFLEGLESVGYTTFYEQDEKQWIITHTNINPEKRGRGLGEKMVRMVLEEAECQQVSVKSYCSFVSSFIANNPRFQPLLD